MTARVELVHTSAADPGVLAAARELLAVVFPDDFTDADWEHSLGGMHAFAWEDGELAGHGAVVMRRLLHGGRALRTGYVEGVGVHPERRRRGHGAALMTALGDVIARAYDLGALGATDEAIPLYERLGWRRWEGPLFALTPRGGPSRTAEEEGAVFVLPGAAALDLRGDLVCDWRDGDVW